MGEILFKGDVVGSQILKALFSDQISRIEGFFTTFRSFVRKTAENNKGTFYIGEGDSVTCYFEENDEGAVRALVTALQCMNGVIDLPIQGEKLSLLEGWLAARFFILHVDDPLGEKSEKDNPSRAKLNTFEKDERYRSNAITLELPADKPSKRIITKYSQLFTVIGLPPKVTIEKPEGGCYTGKVGFEEAYGISLEKYSETISGISEGNAEKMKEKIISMWCSGRAGEILWDSEIENHGDISRIIRTAPAGSRISVAGRTAINVLRKIRENIKTVLENALQIRIAFLNPQLSLAHAHPDEVIAINNDTKECLEIIRDLNKKAVEYSYLPWWKHSLEFLATRTYLFDTILQYRMGDWRQATVLGMSLGKDEGKIHGYFDNPLIFRRFASRINRIAIHSVPYSPSRIVPVLASSSAGDPFRRNSPKEYLPQAVKSMVSLRHRDASIPPPLSVQINLTDKCMTRCACCSACYTDQKADIDSGLLETFFKDIRGICSKHERRLPTLIFSGGEPTLHAEFKSILKKAYMHGFETGILSDGLSIDVEKSLAIATYASWIRISADACSDAVYQKVRNPFEKNKGISSIRDSLKNLSQTCSEKSRRGRCSVGVSYTLQKGNIDEFEKMVEQALRWKKTGLIDRAFFKIAHSNTLEGKEIFLLDQSQLLELLTRMECLGVSTKPGVESLDFLRQSVYRSLVNLPDVEEGKPQRHFYETLPLRCYTPYIFSHIDASGNVYPCCFLYRDNEKREPENGIRKESSMGSLADSSFKDIWYGERFKKFRREIELIHNFKDGQRMNVCGECTRFGQHNHFLNILSWIYNTFPDDSYWQEQIEKTGTSPNPFL